MKKPTLLLLSLLCAVAQAKPPFDDALALWHLADEKDSAGAEHALKVVGTVKLGVALEGAEAEESQDVRISVEVTPGSENGAFGIGLRGRATASESCRLEFDPAKNLVRWNTMTDSALRRMAGPRTENIDLPAKPLRLKIICRRDIVDVEIDGRRTLANRYWEAKGDRLYLWAERGSATFRNLQIRPLREQP